MNLVRFPLRLRQPVVTGRRCRFPRRTASRTVAAFAVAVLALNLGFLAVLDYGPPRLRDPEYGKRLAALKARVRENPGRPLVLVFGSSRTGMGVCPKAWETLGGDPHRPMLFNMALAGSGPVMELMAVRRALADGIKPDAILIEYWPAFLREDGPYWEQARINLHRLRPADLPLVRDYFDDPAKTEHEMLEARMLPWYRHRFALMNQFAASWLPGHCRADAMAVGLDGWGWLPGRLPQPPEKHRDGIAAAGLYYKPLFENYEVSPVADRALRQAVAESRAAGAKVGLVYLPETDAFRALAPAWAAKVADDHLARLRAELDLPLIDGRRWAEDEYLPDGFHLTQPGAVAFTRKLGPAVEGFLNAPAMRR
jgi:hypothetical protein